MCPQAPCTAKAPSQAFAWQGAGALAKPFDLGDSRASVALCLAF